MAEGARLESVYTPKVYRGFESRPLRNEMKEVWDENPGSRQRPSKTILIVEIIPPSPQ